MFCGSTFSTYKMFTPATNGKKNFETDKKLFIPTKNKNKILDNIWQFFSIMLCELNPSFRDKIFAIAVVN